MDDFPSGGLYIIQNNTNHHIYVGSTKDFRKRWNLHLHLLRTKKHHSPHLQAAWNKYGESSFSFHKLQFIEDKQQRLDLEQHFLDTLHPEYNISKLAISVEGCVRSPETRAKISIAVRSDPNRIEHIRKLGIKQKSAEQRAKISDAHIGMRPSDETRAKLRAASAKRWAKIRLKVCRRRGIR